MGAAARRAMTLRLVPQDDFTEVFVAGHLGERLAGLREGKNAVDRQAEAAFAQRRPQVLDRQAGLATQVILRSQ